MVAPAFPFAPQSDLPRPLTRLVGRVREVATLRALIADEGVRLLTLTGTGGVGKTRLAVAVASALTERFPDGVRFVALAAVADPAVVVPTVAQALGVREAGEAPLAMRLAEFLRAKRMLLVLDNLEQVVEAGPFVADLLAACPDLVVLATSRICLRVSGEREYPVQPLPLPRDERHVAFDQVAESDAVRLFVERVRAVRLDFALTAVNAPAVAEVCRRLDGLPLALELAAAWVKVLPPAALLVRLERALPLLTGGGRDLPARQRTMRAAVAWSHDLLTEEAQTLFSRLSVFVGGFDLEGAAAVAGEPEESGLSVLDGVAALADASLLRLEDPDGEPRYLLLETVREYGLERLAASGEEEAIRARHAAWNVALAEAAARALGGSDAAKWLRRLGQEWPNMRAAAVWALERDEPELVLRLSCALQDAVNGLGLGDPREARRWLDAALATGDRVDLALRIDALTSAGVLAGVEGDLARAEALAEQALALAQGQGDWTGKADALHALGLAASFRGDLVRMEELFARSLVLRRATGDRALSGHVLGFLADAALWKGDDARAAALAEEARGLLAETGHQSYMSRLLGTLGAIALAQGDPARAARLYRDYLSQATSFEHARYVADALAGLAGVALDAGDGEEAARLLGAAAAQMEAVGARSMVHHVQYERIMAAARASVSAPGFAAAWVAGRAQGRDEAVAAALAVAAAAEAQTAPPARGTNPAGLTPRELEVLQLLVAGRTDREIGEALFISPHTASKHVANTLAKLGVPSRTAAVAKALLHGLA